MCCCDCDHGRHRERHRASMTRPAAQKFSQSGRESESHARGRKLLEALRHRRNGCCVTTQHLDHANWHTEGATRSVLQTRHRSNSEHIAVAKGKEPCQRVANSPSRRGIAESRPVMRARFRRFCHRTTAAEHRWISWAQK